MVVDDRFDALWERARAAYDVTGTREAAFVRWRYGASPTARHGTFGLTARHSGALVGFVTYRVLHSGCAHVTDLFCGEPPKHLDALLLRFARHAHGAPRVDLVASDDAYARLRLGRRRYIVDGDLDILRKRSQRDPTCRAASRAEVVAKPCNAVWHRSRRPWSR